MDLNSNFIKRLATSIILSPIILYCIFFGDYYFILLLSILFLIAFYEIFSLKKIQLKLILFFFIIFFLYSCYSIRTSNNGLNILFFCIGISWISDTGGYLFGKLVGGKKIKFISPNKTYSGFFGSFFSNFIFFLILKFYNLINMPIYFSFIFTLIVIIGDLFFSYLKRKYKIKDFSNIIPGHGGIFDRIDGLIFLVIIVNFLK